MWCDAMQSLKLRSLHRMVQPAAAEQRIGRRIWTDPDHPPAPADSLHHPRTVSHRTDTDTALAVQAVRRAFRHIRINQTLHRPLCLRVFKSTPPINSSLTINHNNIKFCRFICSFILIVNPLLPTICTLLAEFQLAGETRGEKKKSIYSISIGKQQ